MEAGRKAAIQRIIAIAMGFWLMKKWHGGVAFACGAVLNKRCASAG